MRLVDKASKNLCSELLGEQNEISKRCASAMDVVTRKALMEELNVMGAMTERLNVLGMEEFELAWLIDKACEKCATGFPAPDDMAVLEMLDDEYELIQSELKREHRYVQPILREKVLTRVVDKASENLCSELLEEQNEISKLHDSATDVVTRKVLMEELTMIRGEWGMSYEMRKLDKEIKSIELVMESKSKEMDVLLHNHYVDFDGAPTVEPFDELRG